ncbi:hypothetical protein [Streptomyces nondiastaticus]|uniref:Uncharacterized protein n=1 Tax=Streptomyces nondiastaticus TaxID=3154512 RepID=A0ABW6TRP3_9ACTN
MIKTAEAVFIRCRCTHTWADPRLSAEWFDTMMGPITAVARDFDHAVQALGYDGTLSGTYLH